MLAEMITRCGDPMSLFEPYPLNEEITLANRIVMAPLTRSMADDDLVPTDAMAAYYGRRADAGLIISEATLVAQEGQGYPNGPGLYSNAQIEGWKRVTERVHENGGKIFAQIWHTGRVSHSIYHDGQRPIAPSPVRLEGRPAMTENLTYEVPREMQQEDIDRVVGCFATAAKNAMLANFDGIEIHGANGYLIDQFLHWSSNCRKDKYGGNNENMCRFLFEILDAVKQYVPENLTGLRLLPHAGIDEAWVVMHHDDRDKDVFEYLLKELNKRSLAYVHKGMYDDYVVPHLEGTTTQFIRKHYHGNVITCGGYDVKSGNQVIAQGDADLVAIGRPFIANHDLIHRLMNGKPIKHYDDSMLAVLY